MITEEKISDTVYCKIRQSLEKGLLNKMYQWDFDEKRNLNWQISNEVWILSQDNTHRMLNNISTNNQYFKITHYLIDYFDKRPLETREFK